MTRQKSVADDGRRTLRERMMALTPEERVAWTARLAATDVLLYCAAHGVAPDEARRVMMRRRQAGRRHSGAAQGTSP